MALGFGRRQRHRSVMREVVFTYTPKISRAGHASDFKQECLADAFTDEVGKLLHALYLGGFPHPGCHFLPPKFMNVLQDLVAGGEQEWLPAQGRPNLLEEPWITDGAPANHEAAHAGFGQ